MEIREVTQTDRQSRAGQWKLHLDFYVDAACWGAGISQKLIKYVENNAKEHNAALVCWSTAMDNAQAQVLHDKIVTRTSFVKYLV